VACSFSNPDFQFALRDEIMRRTQGEHETISDFLMCLQALFDRLSPPWSLEEQLNYAHRNMLPRLQIAVRRDSFRDFETLEYTAARVEQSFEAAKQYRALPAADQSIFPDLAYRPPKKGPRTTVAVTAAGLAEPDAKKGKAAKRTRRGTAAATQSSTASSTAPAETAANVVAAPGRTSIKCWNCEKMGHVARECKEAQRLHCYHCGKMSFTVKTCPSCSGNGEGSR